MQDDPALLHRMLTDHKKADEKFVTTNYYKFYEDQTLPYLQNRGLKDFRRINDVAVRGMCALDRSVVDMQTSEVYEMLASFLDFLPVDSSAKSLKEFEASRIGNPESAFSYHGKTLTTRSLNYFYRYKYMGQHLNWSQVKVVCELGSGLGSQAEVIAKLEPHCSLILIDVPPQLYICEQFLKGIFPDRVVGYEESMKINWSNFQPQQGKIYLFGSWKMEDLPNLKADLFFSAGSFSCMEPEVVQYFLKQVDQSQIPNLFLVETQDLADAQKPGDFGVLKKIKLKEYPSFVPNFDLVDSKPTLFFDFVSQIPSWKSMFFKRKK